MKILLTGRAKVLLLLGVLLIVLGVLLWCSALPYIEIQPEPSIDEILYDSEYLDVPA